MKLKKAILLLLLLSLAFVFSACSPKIVSETKAKEAGLAFINQVFDTNQIEAKTQLLSTDSEDDTLNSDDRNASQNLYRYYSVTVTDGTYDGFRYYAEVDGQTGVVYHAEMSKKLLPSLTTEQKALIHQFGAEHGLGARDLDLALLDDVGSTAVEWVKRTVQPDGRVLGAINESIFSDNDQEPLTDINDYVVLENGTIFYVTVVWPTMEITSVTIYNQNTQSQ